MKLIKYILILVCIGSANAIMAQSTLLKGKVIDQDKIPLPNASIIEKGNPGNGARTDANGEFKISLTGANKTIVVSYVGYISKEATIIPNSTTPLTIELSLDAKGLEDVVIVGYSQQKRITSTGAISSIKGEEIRTVPTANVQNTLVGRLPGFFSQQRSGQPGSDGAAFYIRGVNSLNGNNTPLVVVDDVEYDYSQVSQLNANEIESITILKDASTTAVYGLKGANGVLVIKTLRGKIGAPKINLTSEFGVSSIIRVPTYLDSYTTAMLRNEATVNESYGLSSPLALPFTETDLQKFKDGSDPYGHPNVDWYDALIKKASTQSRQNLSVNGGNSFVKYFTSIGYYNQNGLLKSFEPTLEGESVNNNYYYNRVNVRSNLDMTPTKTMKIRFDINGRFETINNPAGVSNSRGLFEELAKYAVLAPYAMPLINPNGTYGFGKFAGGDNGVNPINRLANGGYKRNFNNNFNIIAGIDQKLDVLTQGLSVNANVSYASNVNEARNVVRSLSLPSYYYDATTSAYTIRNAAEYRLPTFGASGGNSAFNSTTIFQGILKYERSFGKHNISSLAIVNQRSIIVGGAVPTNYRGTSFRQVYDYNRKYLFEFDIARNGNDKFRKSDRYGIFPAVSAGWNLAEEPFFKKGLPFVDLFKIRGSYGLVGSDDSYPTTVSDQIQYSTTGANSALGTGVNEGALVNPNVTWEKERKTDIGFELGMFNGKVSATASYFYNYKYDQYISQNDVPLLIGQALPQKNIGITANKGIDGIITYKNTAGKFNYSISGNASYARNKVVYVSEAPDYAYQALTGRQLGLNALAYHSIGFYQQSDFDANGNVKAGIPKPTWSVIQPGDLKYADMNNDGLINDADKTFISKPNLPTTTLGLELGLGFKRFTARALIQGAFDYAVQVNAEGSDAFNSKLTPWHLQRWTPQTAATAQYPRLGLQTNINNSSFQTVSDFWFVNAGYVRLKSVDIGYQLPVKLLRKAKIDNGRVYVSGYNLLTYSKMGPYQQDAEVANGTGNAYPNTANFNFGIQLGF